MPNVECLVAMEQGTRSNSERLDAMASILQLFCLSGEAYASGHMGDLLKAFVETRAKLQQEKNTLESRLRDIKDVLQSDSMPATVVAPVRRGRPPVAPTIKRRKRKMSPAARARISAAAKARWAKTKAAGKKKL